MNAAAQNLIIAITSVAAAAALGVALANRTAAPAAPVVQLKRVVVVGQRADGRKVAQLPRVVVEGRRVATSDVTLAAVLPAVHAI